MALLVVIITGIIISFSLFSCSFLVLVHVLVCVSLLVYNLCSGLFVLVIRPLSLVIRFVLVIRPLCFSYSLVL